MNTKKLFAIALVLMILAAASLLTYNLFFKQPSSGPAEETASPGASPTGSGTAQGLLIRVISQEKSLSPTLGADGKTVKYYSRTSANVFESAFDGSELKTISSGVLPGLIKAVWSPDKTKVIGIFSNGTLKKYFYDHGIGKSALLDQSVGYIGWSPDSKKIVYEYFNQTTGQGNISVADPDGTNWKNIFKTRLGDMIVEWPINEKVSLRTPASGLVQGVLYVINPDTGDFNKILNSYHGLSLKWSPKADKILFSATNSAGKQPVLMMADEKGEQTKDLQLSGLADKCVWSKDDRTVFCAVPQQISENAVWPDDYYKGLTIVNDDFYKINLETGEKTKIAGSQEGYGYDAQELFLSPKEDYLFFVNRRDGLLYILKL